MSNAYQLGPITLLRFTGNDRNKVINNLCTQDFRKLAEGEASETFVTDVKGRTYGHGIVFAIQSEVLFLTVPGYAERLVPHFDRYIIREDAQINDASDAYMMWLWQDGTHLANALQLDPNSLPESKQCRQMSIDSVNITVVHAPWIGPSSLIVLLSRADSQSSIAQKFDAQSIANDTHSREAWESFRIAAGWPWYGVDFDERNLPQELERNETSISFNKGCYLGQETIARLDALGQIQRRLVQLHLTGPGNLSLPFVVTADGKEVGTITSCAVRPDTNDRIALAIIKRSHFGAGQVFDVDGSQATIL